MHNCSVSPVCSKSHCFKFFHFASALTETRASLDPPQFSIVFAQPFNPASQTDSLNQLSVIRVQQIQPWICILISQHIARTVHQDKKKFSSNYTSKSAIITTLYIICIFQLIFKSCIGFRMLIYTIFRIRYITVKSVSIQSLPCLSLISCVPC